MKVWRFVLICAGLVVLLGAALFVARDTLTNVWLKNHLAATLSQALGARVQLDGVSWRDGLLRAGSFSVQGDKLPFAICRADKISAPLEWKKLFAPAELSVRAAAAEMELVWREMAAAQPTATADTKVSDLPSMSVAVTRFHFRHESDQTWSVCDVPLAATFFDGGWEMEARGGTLTVAGFPPVQIERGRTKHRDKEWVIESLTVTEPSGGRLSGQARRTPDGIWSGSFTWENIGLDHVLPDATATHFSGRARGQGTLDNGTFRGQMEITDAETKSMPQLVKLASLFAGENWSTVPWQTFRFDFERTADGTVNFSNMEAVSDRGLWVRGAGQFAPERLSADVQLGVQRAGRPWLVAFMPVLFRTEKDGYFWTSVKVGGTPAAPTEDLTGRIVAALAVAPAQGAVDAATEIPGAAVEAAGGLLKSILGN